MNRCKQVVIILILLLLIIFCTYLIFLKMNELKKETLVKNEITKEKKLINYDGEFELPINGASGYAPYNIELKEAANENSTTITTIFAGDAFLIDKEIDNWWKIIYKDYNGYVNSDFCMINLPDIIPSIIYDNINSYSSIFKSSGYSLDNITGSSLYNAYTYNKRFEENTYNMPILYSMAKKINQIQTNMLENDESLKIYETFRPYQVQMNVGNSLRNLMNSNEIVYNGINNNSWSIGWFIAQGKSNHQLGVAMDVSMVKINEKKSKVTGNYSYNVVNSYTEYEMPTQMHELSTKATTFKYAVNAHSKEAWKKVPLSETMNENAIKLQKYCTDVGLTPLSSEWWHFNDLDARSDVISSGLNFTGDFDLGSNVSIIPNEEGEE